MTIASKPLSEWTAEDLMVRDIVRLPETMPLREAARLLLQKQIGGAPVVDSAGRLRGMLTSLDFVRMAGALATLPAYHTQEAQAVTCGFQEKYETTKGEEVTLCTLPSGVCPIQLRMTDADGAKLLVCTEPHSVPVDWQVVEVEKLPGDEVRRFMSTNYVTVPEDTGIRALARKMIDGHIHRIIVVDNDQRPVGIVTSTNLLTALAESET